MAEIINLNRIRKAKARAEVEKRAEANRIAFGRTKAEKDATRRAAQKDALDLDGKKIED